MSALIPSSRLLLWSCVAVLALSFSLQSPTTGDAAEKGSSIVQSALRSEIDQDIDERFRLLDAALERDPKLPEAHWARGDVNVGGQWRSLETAVETAVARDDLKQYEAERSRVENTVQGHERMASYCRKNRLPAQERAHWTAVVALDPNHTEARQRLGQVRIDGVWIDEKQLERLKRAERESHDYVVKHGKAVMKLVRSLQNKLQTHQQVVRALCQFHDPLVVQCFETYVSTRGEDAALCAVEALASFPFPEASLSLARHALDFPIESIRDAAAKSLMGRDEQSYVPALLATLKTPVTTSDEFSVNRDNMLIWRRTVSYETQDAKKVTSLDRIFGQESYVAADVATANWMRRFKTAGDAEVDQMNQKIASTNQRAMAILTKVAATSSSGMQPASAADSAKSPDDWWNWWNDRIESYPSDAKVVQTRSESAFISAAIIESSSRPRHECLAAGTQIWTETGPIRVEEIQVGDMALTQNQRTGELKFCPVLATSNRPPEKLLSLNVGGETIRATGGHPFWVSGKGWIKTRSLEPGMGLHTARGVVMLDAVEEETNPAATYNLIVDECHSYFVGQHLLLSHDNTVREAVANRVPGLRDDFVNARRN